VASSRVFELQTRLVRGRLAPNCSPVTVSRQRARSRAQVVGQLEDDVDVRGVVVALLDLT